MCYKARQGRGELKGLMFILFVNCLIAIDATEVGRVLLLRGRLTAVPPLAIARSYWAFRDARSGPRTPSFGVYPTLNLYGKSPRATVRRGWKMSSSIQNKQSPVRKQRRRRGWAGAPARWLRVGAAARQGQPYAR
eukprot:6186840-Pleurochrysis_carterae.AAC.1